MVRTILLLSAFALLGTACAEEVPPSEEPMFGSPGVAWWVEATFRPDRVRDDALEARSISLRWSRINLLGTEDLRGRISGLDLQDFRASGYRLRLDADLNGNNSPETFRVGVYAEEDGEEGRFLVVTEGDRVLQHFTMPGEPSFSALDREEGIVLWYMCMECSDFQIVTWDSAQERYRMERPDFSVVD